jgi:hypothetical protein
MSLAATGAPGNTRTLAMSLPWVVVMVVRAEACTSTVPLA